MCIVRSSCVLTNTEEGTEPDKNPPMPTDQEIRSLPAVREEIEQRIEADPRIARLERQREQLTNRLTRLRNEQRTRERKRETRRLILLGRLLRNDMRDDPEFAQRIRLRLDGFLTRPGDRALFGLDHGQD